MKHAYTLAVIAVTLASAGIVGCGGSAATLDASDDLAGARAAAAATLGMLAADAVVLAEASQVVAAQVRSGGEGEPGGNEDPDNQGGNTESGNGETERNRLRDGSICSVGENGQLRVERPDGTVIEGSVEGGMQIRRGDGWLAEGEQEQGEGETHRIRLRLQNGAECLVDPPGTPEGALECHGPGSWVVEVTENEDGSLTVAFASVEITVVRNDDGTLTATLGDNSNWQITLNEDGSITATSPSGGIWTLSMTEAAIMVTTPSGATHELAAE